MRDVEINDEIAGQHECDRRKERRKCGQNIAGENPIASTAPRNSAARTQLRCGIARPLRMRPRSLHVPGPVQFTPVDPLESAPPMLVTVFWQQAPGSS